MRIRGGITDLSCMTMKFVSIQWSRENDDPVPIQHIRSFARAVEAAHFRIHVY
jgi:hypothetical protein